MSRHHDRREALDMHQRKRQKRQEEIARSEDDLDERLADGFAMLEEDDYGEDSELERMRREMGGES